MTWESKESTPRQAKVDAVFGVLKSVMEPYDWDAIRADEAPKPRSPLFQALFFLICWQDKVLIPMTPASIMAGGVFERDATSLLYIVGVSM